VQVIQDGSVGNGGLPYEMHLQEGTSYIGTAAGLCVIEIDHRLFAFLLEIGFQTRK
jgi:hypothetical protein